MKAKANSNREYNNKKNMDSMMEFVSPSNHRMLFKMRDIYSGRVTAEEIERKFEAAGHPINLRGGDSNARGIAQYNAYWRERITIVRDLSAAYERCDRR